MDVIFGSTGFIGQNLYRYLKTKIGDDNILQVSRNYGKKKLKVNQVKLNLKYKRNISKLKLSNINTVYICSANPKTHIKNSIEGNKQINDNVKILRNILFFCNKFKPKNIIFLSSSSVYSTKNKYPLTEDDKIFPESYLGKSKKINEKQLLNYSKKNDSKVLILRIFTVYGKKMRKNQFIYQLKQKIVSKKNITIFNPETLRNMIFVKDLTKIIYRLSTIKNKKFEIFNIGTNETIKVYEIYKLFAKIKNKKHNISFSFNKNNLNHEVNLNRMQKKIGKFKFTKLSEGLKEI